MPGPVQAEPESVGRSPLSTQVRSRVLEWITDGTLAPGQRIIETQVARQLGISQAPVREAMRDLAGLGVVETRPYQGSRVRRPDLQELTDAILVRAQLEALAGRLAAVRVTDTCLKGLERLADAMAAAGRAGDLARYDRVHTEFHRTIVAAAGNRPLERVWEMLDLFVSAYGAAPVAPADLEWQAQRHRRALRALGNRDPERAGTIARSHALDRTA